MAEVNVIFNGKNLVGDDSQTVLSFAKSQGVDIPTLCYDSKLDPYGSCFLCVVEVKGARTLVPACATNLREGMEMTTNSDRVSSSRKTALELILSNHYGDCIAPCKTACPAHCDIQGYVGLIANNRYDDAIKLIKETIPLPASIGRVCPKFCEDKCRRQFVDEPIAIDYLKRFVADKDLNSDTPYSPILKSKNGKKVAIVGGGPAGLSAAYYLIQEGVDVEIFEAKDKLGGMLLYGIPQYRLPKDILAKEISTIIDLGVKVNYNKVLGRDFTIDSLKSSGFDAVVVACGAWSASKLGVPNEDAENILDGIKFLENIADGKEVKISGRVAIVGGGNTAFDCARTALRLGAKEVVMVYRRTRDEMPANEVEKDEAEEEGIKFQLLTLPVSVVKEQNKAVKLVCQKMMLGEPDSSGRKKPIPIEGSEFEEKYDFIIAAIGQKPDYQILGNNKEKLLNNNKWIPYNEKTGQTNNDHIFIAGDYATGAATVVEALAGGKKTSNAILKFFNGVDLEPAKEFLSTREDLKEISPEFFLQWDKAPRNKIKILSPEKRKSTFDEIESPFTEKSAITEANRCMECGCMDVYQCSLKKYAEEYNAEDNKYCGKVNEFKFDLSSQYLFREPSKCILCGRCVKLCSEIIGIGVYGYVKRGFDSIVMPKFQFPLSETDCISCGTCISGCPVGAIVPNVPNKKKVPLKGERIDTYCYHCSIGCENSVEIFNTSIYEVHEREKELCKKGRFHIPEIVKDKEGCNQKGFDKLKFLENAVVYPSPSLSIEDYESIKEVGKILKWEIANYYSQSSLWRAFAGIKSLPKMDFFNKEFGDNTLVIVCGDIDKTNPISINRLNKIIKDDTVVCYINTEKSLRLDRLNGKMATSINEFEKTMGGKISSYNDVVLLINPISFDQLFGKDASLKLYNYIARETSNLRTTLFSEARNLYSFYDADFIPDLSKKRSVYIQTIPTVNIKEDSYLISELYLDANFIEENCTKISYSLQDDGSFLNSKNIIYKNIPIFKNDKLTLRNILKNNFKIGELKNCNHKNIEVEKPVELKDNKEYKFPEDIFIKKYSNRK